MTTLAVSLPLATARLVLRLAFDDLGFRQEARFVDGASFTGAWVTTLVFALLEDEWPAASRGM